MDKTTKTIANRPASRRTAVIATAAASAVLAAMIAGADATSAQAKRSDDLPRAMSALGAYLAARHAVRQKDTAAAAAYFAMALSADPANETLRRNSFIFKVGDGRIPDALPLARAIVAAQPNHGPANILLGLEAAKARQLSAAFDHFGKVPIRGEHTLLIPLLKAWTLLARKRPAKAVDELAALTRVPQFRNFHDLHAGLIRDISGSRKAAEKHFLDAYRRNTDPPMRIAQALATFYWRTGKTAQARKIYVDYLKKHAESLSVQVALQRLDAGRPAKRQVGNAMEGLAEALFNLASALHQERQEFRALIYAQMAAYLRPAFPTNQYLLGRIFDARNQTSAATRAYDSIPRSSPFSWNARLAMARNLYILKRNEEAVKVLRQMADERKDRWDSLYILGNLHRAAKEYVQAAAAYDRAVSRLPKIEKRHWNLFYARGISLERSKKWKRAERDFLKALDLNPDQPFVLNYLAYSWVERGENLARARKMLERAVRKRPADGAIIDSLGWVLYRTGYYKEAVVQLERAARRRPQDPVINDHLGDAYWRVGRRHEARFQWRRALSYNPEKEEIPKIMEKLRKGLKMTPPLRPKAPGTPKR